MGSDWIYYNEAAMLLEWYENLLLRFVKQLVIQLNLASSVSLGQTISSVWKSKYC